MEYIPARAIWRPSLFIAIADKPAIRLTIILATNNARTRVHWMDAKLRFARAEKSVIGSAIFATYWPSPLSVLPLTVPVHL